MVRAEESEKFDLDRERVQFSTSFLATAVSSIFFFSFSPTIVGIFVFVAMLPSHCCSRAGKPLPFRSSLFTCGLSNASCSLTGHRHPWILVSIPADQNIALQGNIPPPFFCLTSSSVQRRGSPPESGDLTTLWLKARLLSCFLFDQIIWVGTLLIVLHFIFPREWFPQSIPLDLLRSFSLDQRPLYVFIFP